MSKSIKTLAKTEPVFLTFNTLQRYQNALSSKGGANISTITTRQLVTLLVIGEYLDITVDDIVKFEFIDDDVLVNPENNTAYFCIPFVDAELEVLSTEFVDYSVEQLEIEASKRTDKQYVFDFFEKTYNTHVDSIDTENKGVYLIYHS